MLRSAVAHVPAVWMQTRRRRRIHPPSSWNHLNHFATIVGGGRRSRVRRCARMVWMWGVVPHGRRRVRGLDRLRGWWGMRQGSVLRLGMRRVRRIWVGRCRGLGRMSHGGRLSIAAAAAAAAAAIDGLCRVGDVGRRGRILETLLRLPWCSRRASMHWLRGVAILLRARRILRGAGLRVGRSRRVRKGWLWSISWPLVWREVAVVPHGNGLDGLGRILLTRLPEFILRGCSCYVSCAVWLWFTRIAA